MYAPGETENVISMESFSGMLESVACTNTSMTLAFSNTSDLQHAVNSWDWVNKADSHAFILVAGPSDCHWNDDRQPFNVTNVGYDNDTATANLAAVPIDWESVAHSYDLSVGQAPTSMSQIQARGWRDWSHDSSFNLSYLVPPTALNKPINGLTTTVECIGCSSAGNIDWNLQISVLGRQLTKGTLKMTPTGVSATATLRLTESGELTEPIATSLSFPPIAIDSVTIGKLLDLGPSLIFGIGFSIDAIKGSGSVTGGGDIDIPDSSIVEIDLVNFSNSVVNGWEPHVNTLPLSLDAQIEAKLEVYVQSALKIRMEVLGKLIRLSYLWERADGSARYWS